MEDKKGDEILSRIKGARYYALNLDCIPDLSWKEQLLRKKLKKYDLDIYNCRGLRYDNVANMKGKNSLLQK